MLPMLQEFLIMSSDVDMAHKNNKIPLGLIGSCLGNASGKYRGVVCTFIVVQFHYCQTHARVGSVH